MHDKIGTIDHRLVGCRIQIGPRLVVRRNVVDSPDRLGASPSSLVQGVEELLASPFRRVTVDPSVERLRPMQVNHLRTDCPLEQVLRTEDHLSPERVIRLPKLANVGVPDGSMRDENQFRRRCVAHDERCETKCIPGGRRRVTISEDRPAFVVECSIAGDRLTQR